MGRKLTKEEFLNKAKEIHGDKYDYSKVEYVDILSPVVIICPIHGEFLQTPNNHINNHRGCPECGKIKSLENKRNRYFNKLIDEANVVHDGKYDYSLVEYVKEKEPVDILCPVHGVFKQSLYKHVYQCQGCPKCGIEKRSSNRTKDTEWFVSEAKKIHGNKYDYSLVDYKKSSEKVDIVCPEHGLFKMTPNKHLLGHGCPECVSKNNVLENRLFRFITNRFPEYNVIHQYKNEAILGKQSIDIFIEELNIGIEYQGLQHFKPVSLFGGDDGFKNTVERDKLKYSKCIDNGIKLFYFTYKKWDITDNYFAVVYYNEEELLNAINKER